MKNLAVITLVATLAMGTACSDLSTSSGGDSTGSPAKTTKKVAGIGDAVRDGKFEFVVRSVSCGKTSVGTSLLGKKAQGQFCLIALSVRNIGKEPQSLFGDNQYLFDAQGRRFSADTEAAIYLEDSKTLYEEINPGNGLDGTLIFDIPKGGKPARLELHDSAFSGGVTVRLG